MRSALWALFAVLALTSASCGGGTDEQAPGNMMAGTTAGGAGQGGQGGTAGNPNGSCGDLRVDPLANEQCEPMVPHNLSCEALGMGRGLIACSSTCKLMMMCVPPEEPMGGTDGSAGGGTGG
jgi:hypothetical protein